MTTPRTQLPKGVEEAVTQVKSRYVWPVALSPFELQMIHAAISAYRESVLPLVEAAKKALPDIQSIPIYNELIAALAAWEKQGA